MCAMLSPAAAAANAESGPALRTARCPNYTGWGVEVGRTGDARRGLHVATEGVWGWSVKSG